MKRCLNLMRMVSCALVLAVLAGCATDKESLLKDTFQPAYAPLPPGFLTGAIGRFLSQQTAFSARVEAAGESSAPDGRVTGQLFGVNGALVFAADPDPETHKERPEEIFTFIWNPANGTGYVLNDALQGYAPVTYSSLVSSNTVTAPATDLKIIRAAGPSNFPVEVSISGLTVKLSKVRMRAPAADLLEPPKGFTKYSSPELMAQELAMRRFNLKREVQ